MTQLVILLTVAEQLAGNADIHSSCSYQVGFKVNFESIPELFSTEHIWSWAWRQVHSYSKFTVIPYLTSMKIKAQHPDWLLGSHKLLPAQSCKKACEGQVMWQRKGHHLCCTHRYSKWQVNFEKLSVLARMGSGLGWTQGASYLLATPRKVPGPGPPPKEPS